LPPKVVLSQWIHRTLQRSRYPDRVQPGDAYPNHYHPSTEVGRSYAGQQPIENLLRISAVNVLEGTAVRPPFNKLRIELFLELGLQMALKKLTNDFVVSAQITESDIIEAAKNGFVAIIGNRPDGEDAGQPSAEVTAVLARKHGLKFAHIPVITGAIRDADVAKMAAELAAANGPVLAYCRSGTRATLMWALAQAGHMPADAIFAATAKAGVDITPVKAEILQRAARMAGSGREAPPQPIKAAG
jgi:uncharacterized protein (TIGR01244 family)